MCVYVYSGKHKIVWPRPYGRGTFILGTKKPVMPKKKVFVARNLKDSYQIYHSERKSKKDSPSFFITTILCFPDIYILHIYIKYMLAYIHTLQAFSPEAQAPHIYICMYVCMYVYVYIYCMYISSIC